MDLQLQGKIVIVSGGAKGIGLGIVKQLAAEKALPVIVGRNEKDNVETIHELKRENLIAEQVVAELTEPSACEQAVHEVVKKVW